MCACVMVIVPSSQLFSIRKSFDSKIQGTNRVSSNAVVLCLSRQTIFWSLPSREGLGFMVVHIHWPLPRHVNDIIDGSVPACVCVCVFVCVHIRV